MEAVFNVSLVAHMAQMAHFVYCVAAIVYGRLERLTPWYDSKAYLLEYWAIYGEPFDRPFILRQGVMQDELLLGCGIGIVWNWQPVRLSESSRQHEEDRRSARRSSDSVTFDQSSMKTHDSWK